MLFAWIGRKDLESGEADGAGGVGPIASAVTSRDFERVVLLSTYPGQSKAYATWLRRKTAAKVEVREVELRSPTDHEDIYRVVLREVDKTLAASAQKAALTFHLSPGTPAMAAVWIIVAKTRHPAELIESSQQHGVKTASVPFEMAVELVPEIVRGADAGLRRMEEGLRPSAPEFGDITHRSEVMRDLIDRAQQCAAYSEPVLIQGESGTGKEMLARALHRASLRSAKPFVVVNCGAIPPELVESEFFGHERGSFSGAVKDRIGHFESAHGGTIFLDEIGELPLAAQVKLLRILQEGKLVRVGTSKEIAVDVRVIAATHRDLAGEVAAGRFREDLFYRLAVLVLTTPPLRERRGDVGLLVDATLDKLNQTGAAQGRTPKKLSPAARNLLLHHPWPGNVRELTAVLLRAVVFSRKSALDEQDVRQALSAGRVSPRAQADVPIEPGFVLEEHLDDLSRRYIRRALDQGGGKKKAAADLLGFANYQTLSNWMARLGIEP